MWCNGSGVTMLRLCLCTRIIKTLNGSWMLNGVRHLRLVFSNLFCSVKPDAPACTFLPCLGQFVVAMLSATRPTECTFLGDAFTNSHHITIFDF